MISEDSKISLMQSESNFPGASKKHPFQWPAAVRPRIITFFKLIDRCISFDLETVTKSLGLPGSQRWQAFWRPYLHPKMLGRCWLDGWSDWLDVSVCSKHQGILENVFMWIYVFKAEASNGGEEWSWERSRARKNNKSVLCVGCQTHHQGLNKWGNKWGN